MSAPLAVASFAEAWIETFSASWERREVISSPPSRRRGSKPRLRAHYITHTWSPPSRRRGSKQSGARGYSLPGTCRLLRGGVDRNSKEKQIALTHNRRLLRGGVDRNKGGATIIGNMWASPPSRRRGSKHALHVRRHVRPDSRLLRGGVDRNNLPDITHIAGRCRLLRGGVDRNSLDWEAIITNPPSPPSRRRGSKHSI